MKVSLTTIPPRSHLIDSVIQSILDQTEPPDEIILNIPKKYNRFPNENVKLTDFTKKHCNINYCKDCGPITKILPSMRLYNERIISIDDDCILPPNVISTYNKILTDLNLSRTALCFRGRVLSGPSYDYNMSSLIEGNKQRNLCLVDIITGVNTACYNSDAFDIDLLEKLHEEPSNLYMNDDIILSGELYKKGIPAIVVPINGTFQTTESTNIGDLWSSNARTNNNNLLIQKYW